MASFDVKIAGSVTGKVGICVKHTCRKEKRIFYMNNDNKKGNIVRIYVNDLFDSRNGVVHRPRSTLYGATVGALPTYINMQPGP
jgi:hypothetical protein